MTELDVALDAAQAAARLLGQRPDAVRFKGAVDLVTEIDLAADATIREILARHTPGIAIHSEEGSASLESTRWIVDPIDGTTNFVHGFGSWAVSIALEVDGRAEVGVVVNAPAGVTFSASRGGGAWANGRRLQVSTCRDLGEALLGTGFPYDRRERVDVYLAFVRRALLQGRGIRRAGAASLDLCAVAEGKLDAYWEFTLESWDVAAGSLLVEEAGGRVTRLDGAPLSGERRAPLATNGWLHDQMLNLLEGAVESL